MARLNSNENFPAMISTDRELEDMQERVHQFERQVAQLRQAETNPENYRMSAGGFLAEIDRMNLEIRDYLWSHSDALRTSVGT